MTTRILIVEDELPIREGLVDLLRVHEFAVDEAANGTQALAQIARGGYDLVVLDLMIPPPTGLEVLSHMRASGDGTPVLVLTARGAESDIVEGIERGADDYVTKPFGVKELVARIRGLLRRSTQSTVQEVGAASGGAPSGRMAIGGSVLDVANSRLEYGDDERLELTARESMLLAFLFMHRTRVVSRAELLVQVWGYRDGKIETRTVDVTIQKLRSKLRVVPGGENWIETLRGMGYRLAAS
jgi:two-component system response regulator RegX3